MTFMIKTRKRASEVRKRLAQIPRELTRDMEALLRQRELFRGYVYHSRRRCGKPTCRCARGKLHEAWVVATTVGGRRTTRSLSGRSAKRVTALAANYRGFRQAQRSLRRRYREAMTLIGELEELMCVDVFETDAKKARKRR